MHLTDARRHHPRAALGAAALCALSAAAALAACTPDQPQSQSIGTQPGSSHVSAGSGTGVPGDGASASASGPSVGGASPSAGCAPTSQAMPAGARAASIVDVDGDGKADRAWFADPSGGARRFGVTTASGATWSTSFDSASPIRASAVVNRVGSGRVPIALVDTGRAVALYSLADCRIAQTLDQQGRPYTFDKGFTGYGTGVGCPRVGGALRLAGLNARTDDGGATFTVTRTLIDLRSQGTRAGNGSTQTVAKGAGAKDRVVTTAQQTTCGAYGAGHGGLVEPQD